MARPKKLKSVKELNGTLRKDRDPDGISYPMRVAPLPPAVLAERMTSEELEVYQMVEPLLRAYKVLNDANIFEFIRYCRLAAQSDRLNQQITEDIYSKESHNKFMREKLSERVKWQKAISEQLSVLTRRFGLDPQSLDALKLRDEESDDLDKLMNE